MIDVRVINVHEYTMINSRPSLTRVTFDQLYYIGIGTIPKNQFVRKIPSCNVIIF